MSEVPVHQKIYHITHVDNLPSILASNGLLSDDRLIKRSRATTNIGMTEIKRRRLDLRVGCHPETTVGQYVPFFFCPRSIMLFIIHRANHPDLPYKDGQRPIVHLEADLDSVVGWVEAHSRRWAFSTSNAGARYARFFNDLRWLTKIDWAAVAACDFRDSAIKEQKQAEFLVFEHLPWHLVEQIGVMDTSVASRLTDVLNRVDGLPPISVRRD